MLWTAPSCHCAASAPLRGAGMRAVPCPVRVWHDSGRRSRVWDSMRRVRRAGGLAGGCALPCLMVRRVPRTTLALPSRRPSTLLYGAFGGGGRSAVCPAMRVGGSLSRIAPHAPFRKTWAELLLGLHNKATRDPSFYTARAVLVREPICLQPVARSGRRARRGAFRTSLRKYFS